MQREILLQSPLTMATANLVNLEKTSECLQLKTNCSLATQNKTFNNFGRKLKRKSAFKLSREGPILLVFVNWSQIFFEGLLVIVINKAQSFSYNQSHLMVI